MTTIFGEVADDYDRIRPGYPASIASAIGEYVGYVPSLVAEVGAGTGKGTELFARLGAPLLCVEPDPRMAAKLTRRVPTAHVVISDFESWTPPPGGVPVLAGALMWHLLPEGTRLLKARSVLAPGGVVAIVGRKHVHSSDIDAVFRAHGAPANERPHAWIHDELASAFDDVRMSRHDTELILPAADYLRLVSTWSSFRRLPADRQSQLVGALREVIGDTVHIELQTTLNLARQA